MGILGEPAPKLTPCATVALRDFTMTVERIHAPAELSSTFYESVREMLPPVRTDASMPWNRLCEAWNEWCGIATYETTFSLDRVPARALFMPEHVCDTYEVHVNGVRFDQGDPALRATDITSALVSGENRIRVIVAGTLKNEVSLAFIRRAAPPDRPREAQDLGMWGEVKIELYG
jgi:hypothetical protein